MPNATENQTDNGTGAAAPDLGGAGAAEENTPAGQPARNTPATETAPDPADAQKTQDGNSNPGPKDSLLSPQPEQPDDPAGEPAGDPATDPLDQPLVDLKDFTPALWPDQDIDPDLLQSFGQQAIKAGLSARQARALVDWQLESLNKIRESMYAAGAESLKKEWGANAEQIRQDTLALVASIDRQLGDERFSKALAATGAGLNPAIIAGLAKAAAMLGEDRIASASGASAPTKEETALDGLKAALEEARRRQG